MPTAVDEGAFYLDVDMGNGVLMSGKKLELDNNETTGHESDGGGTKTTGSHVQRKPQRKSNGL